MKSAAIFAVVLAVMVGTAVAQQPTSKARLAERRYREGVQMMHAERWENAALEFKTAIELDPFMALAHYNLGQCRMAQRRYVEAVAAYRRACEAFQQVALLSLQEREAYDRARRDEINELRTLVRVSLARGDTNEEAMQLESRIRVLEGMQSLIPNEREIVPGEVMLALGSAYFRQEKFVDAEREWEAAIAAKRNFGEAHNNLAVLYMMTGRKKDAESAVKAAERAGFRVNPGLKDDIRKMP